MEIPDCWDPVYQEERRQASWDAFLEKLPACACCGETLLPGQRLHRAGSARVCRRCMEELEENEEVLEDPNDDC